MMVKMFVCTGSPLLRSEGAEEGMRMARAFRFAAARELRHHGDELRLLVGKDPFVHHHKRGMRRTVPAERFLAEIRRFKDRAEDISDGHTFRCGSIGDNF